MAPPVYGLYGVAVLGDRVEIIVDVGGGVREFDVTATRAGRRVEVSIARGTVEVSEVTRSGQAVRSARFMAARVVALVEHPAGAEQQRADDHEPRSGRVRPPTGQPSLELG